jgi:hypothetical protein
VAPTCNPSHSRDQEDQGSKPSKCEALSSNPSTTKKKKERKKAGHMDAIMERVTEEVLSYSVIFDHKPDKNEGKSHEKEKRISRRK